MGYEEISEAKERSYQTQATRNAANAGPISASRILRVRIEQELQAAHANVRRLQELLVLLDQNPNFSRIVELLGMDKL